MAKMVAIGWYTHGPFGQQLSIFVFGTLSLKDHVYTLGVLSVGWFSHFCENQLVLVL